MSLVEWHALVVGLLLAAGGLSWLAGRRRSVAVLSLAVGSIVYGLHQGILLASDAATLPEHAGLQWTLLQWMAWAFFATAVGSKPRERMGGRFAPVLFGAVFGELGGAVLSATGEDKHRVRRVLASSAGALLARVGDPAVLMWDGPEGWRLAVGLGVCALLGIAVAAPPQVEWRPFQRQTLALGGVVAIASFLPMLTVPMLVVGGVALMDRKPDLSPVYHTLGLGLLLLVAVAGGAVEHVASLLEAATIPYERWMPQIIAGTGALAGLTLGSGGGGALGVGVLDRALAVRTPDAAALWTVMAAVSGLGPLVVTRTVWRGLPRHLLWVALSLGVVHGMVLVGLLR